MREVVLLEGRVVGSVGEVELEFLHRVRTRDLGVLEAGRLRHHKDHRRHRRTTVVAHTHNRTVSKILSCVVEGPIHLFSHKTKFCGKIGWEQL